MTFGKFISNSKVHGQNRYGSPNSGVQSNRFSTVVNSKAAKNTNLHSPKGSGKNHTQVMTTASMMSLFNDMSKKVTKQLSNNEYTLKGNFSSQKDLRIKKSKLSLPSGKAGSIKYQ